MPKNNKKDHSLTYNGQAISEINVNGESFFSGDKISLLGYVSYKQLPVELLPNAELPVLFIQVSSQQDMDPS